MCFLGRRNTSVEQDQCVHWYTVHHYGIGIFGHVALVFSLDFLLYML